MGPPGTRIYKTPRILDQQVRLKYYQGEIRQLAILDLGHEEPTLLLTNQLRRSPAKLIERYAQRMVIENHIAEGINFFHMDALSSADGRTSRCCSPPALTWLGGKSLRLIFGR